MKTRALDTLRGKDSNSGDENCRQGERAGSRPAEPQSEQRRVSDPWTAGPRGRATGKAPRRWHGEARTVILCSSRQPPLPADTWAPRRPLPCHARSGSGFRAHCGIRLVGQGGERAEPAVSSPQLATSHDPRWRDLVSALDWHQHPRRAGRPPSFREEFPHLARPGQGRLHNREERGARQWLLEPRPLWETRPDARGQGKWAPGTRLLRGLQRHEGKHPRPEPGPARWGQEC